MTSRIPPVEVTIHVGLSKAASTFLQETFFPGLADALFINAPYLPPQPANPIQVFVRELLYRNNGCLDVASIRTEIAGFLAQSGHDRVVVSSEALAGTPYENLLDFRSNTDVLAEVFEAPKIWFIVRRQDRWLESWYSQTLKMGLSTSPERFTNFRGGEFGDYERPVYAGPNLDVRDLDWCCFVERYWRRFGKDRVLVQPYELLPVDPAGFFARFCEFAGVARFVPPPAETANPGLSPVSAFAARVANALPMSVKLGLKRFVPTRLHPAHVLNRTLDPLLPRRRLFPSDLADAALALHREHNRRLAEMIGVDLGEHGYY